MAALAAVALGTEDQDGTVLLQHAHAVRDELRVDALPAARAAAAAALAGESASAGRCL